LVRGTHTRGTNIIRTLVVGASTLAILLVCFALYQSSQRDALPAERTADRAAGYTDPAAGSANPLPAEDNSGSLIGAGRRITFTSYQRHGQRARFEFSMQDYRPVPGTDNEFTLVAPVVRMRTSAGQNVRITADEGYMEAERKAQTSFDPLRGRLRGNIVIEIDRRSDAQREALPLEERNRPDPASVIRVELDQIEFDVEYAKVVIPGAFHLSASDVVFEGADLEARFNEAANRVEYLRVERGERLLLRQQTESFLGARDGSSLVVERELSLVDMLRATLERRLAARRTQPKSSSRPSDGAGGGERPAAQSPPGVARATPLPAPPPTGTPPGSESSDEIPPFEPENRRDRPPPPPVQYTARFEGDIDVLQQRGDETISRLQSDLLEIRRDFRRDFAAAPDETTTGGKKQPTSPAGGAAPTPPDDTIQVTWVGPLLVQTTSSEPGSEDAAPRAMISATGTPVRVSHQDGGTDATCHRLVFLPDEQDVHLWGSVEHPAVVRSTQHGVLTGIEIESRRSGDQLNVLVQGPGVLLQDRAPGDISAALPDPGSASDATGGARAPSDSASAGPFPEPGDEAGDERGFRADFTDRMELAGHYTTSSRLDFTGTISTREARVIDRVLLEGAVRLVGRGTELRADRLILLGDARAGRHNARAAFDRMEGRGDVLMVNGADRVECREIDVELRTDHEGGLVPTRATARGDVRATQGERLVTARDSLVMELDTFLRPAPPFDVLAEYARAKRLGEDVSRIDWSARRRAHEERRRKVIGAKRLEVVGDVHISDPVEHLEVSAERVECSIHEGREVEAAVVTGLSAGSPAAVRMGTFTLSGARIDMNVRDDWATVAGRGRMTFRSAKDLNGRKVDPPVPIVIDWAEGMSYSGRENRATFTGEVHAASEDRTTFDCGRLVVEFDVPADGASAEGSRAGALSDRGGGTDWWIFEDLAPLIRGRETAGDSPERASFGKEPARIDAYQSVRLETSEYDATGRTLRNRATLWGEKLSLNLRKDVSLMLIEGPGQLLLEDNQGPRRRTASGTAPGSDATVLPAADTAGGSPGADDRPVSQGSSPRGLFSAQPDDGPSKIAIEWSELMWYDFAFDQTRFEGKVALTYMSGTQVQALAGGRPESLGGMPKPSGGSPAGRNTLLTCDLLTVDFLGSPTASNRDGTRMGRISASKLRQFKAAGNVVLEDKMQPISLNADQLIYERDRSILILQGSRERPARLIYPADHGLPRRFTAERIVVETDTGRVTSTRQTFQGP
jgi:hypothetical protein